jgi:CO dehydrogenase/acetyl-CoA synthase gamma subunit (corrinoid Fe-S protein)
MKKILLLVAIFATTLLSAQTGGYWVQEFKAKMNTGNDLTEAFDKIFKDSKFNKGAIVLSELTTGSQGMTHRIAWQFTIGTDMMEKDAISPDKWDAFFSKLIMLRYGDLLIQADSLVFKWEIMLKMQQFIFGMSK